MTLRDAEKLISKPRRWPTLTEAELEELIKTACWLAAGSDDATLQAAVGRLYEHVVGTLGPDVRRRIVGDLGETLEQFGRTHGTCPVAVLEHWLLSDPDFGVVSTAALESAQLMDTSDQDPLYGPRSILELATTATDPDRQSAIVTGLAAMGDGRVHALIDDAWDRLACESQDEILQHMGGHLPKLASVEFLVSRVERATDDGEEGPIGSVVASLVQISDAAGEIAADSPFSGSVRDIERTFPSWRTAADANVVTVRAVYTVADIGKRIGPRLVRLASGETYPRLIPLALRAWEAEDTPFVDAVRQAVAESKVHTGQCAVLDEPIPIEPPPDWDRDDAVLEWGILNPFGPTKVQMCLVTLDEDTGALVYSLHNPFGPVCLLLGVTKAGPSVGVREMLLELADRFHVGDHVLLKGLPHWVRTSQEPELLTLSDGAAFFRTLHQAALAEDLAIDGDIDVLIRELDQLRRDPQQEVRRQFAQAMELTRASLTDAEARGADAALATVGAKLAQHAPATSDIYQRWFSAASSPEHVSDVSSHFLDCWKAALRFRRGSADDSE
jgi:hypothetical protein